MHAAADSLLDIVFEAAVIEWRGPAPFYFVAIPPAHLGEVSYVARQVSYGWGCVPVMASIAGASFATSLFPKDGGYLLPLKAAVRAQVGIAPGEGIRVRMRVVRAGVTDRPAGAADRAEAAPPRATSGASGGRKNLGENGLRAEKDTDSSQRSSPDRFVRRCRSCHPTAAASPS